MSHQNQFPEVNGNTSQVNNMPYRKLTELPDNVKNNLPEHAQEIYLAAFNSAWKQYKDPADRDDDDDRETVAHKVAWSAVKEKYEKRSGKWTKKH
jgi:cation transport regulator